jgi:hypothetical protein
MSYSQSQPARSRKPAYRSGARRPKVFTDYPMPLAFERIEFYLRVLEAHFERLGARRRQDEEESRGLSRATQEGE